MLGFAWLTLRQAQDALRHGRLEEAQRLLAQPAAQGHRRAGPLLADLARAFVERGERQLKHDDADGAWRDLLQAEHLQTAEKEAGQLRQALTRLGIAEVRALFQAGEVRRADEAVVRLRERRVRSAELQVLEDAVKGWLRALDLADRGEFARALEAVERLRRLILGPVRPLEEFARELEKRQQDFAALLPRLHEAADGARWREVVELSEQALALAPQHVEARKVRGRAWKAIEPVTVAMRPPGTAVNGQTPGANGEHDTASGVGGGNGVSAVGGETHTRFLLWVDGVGGYLLCLGSRLTLGQASLDGHADVPLVADVSRLHASLTRDSEGYVLEAVRPVQVNGQLTTRALLRPGDRVTLGTSCQFQFHQPVPVSASARLDLVSGHRVPAGVDAVLLMADTLVLGEGPQVHVTVPDLKQPVVLFRHKDGLGLRHGGRLTVNGERGGDRALLPATAAVSGEDVSFALEPAGDKM
jgi:hypothetical protein